MLGLSSRWRVVVLLTALMSALSLFPGQALAQGEDLLTSEFCSINPNWEICICRDLVFYNLVPINVTYDGMGVPTASYGDIGPTVAPGRPGWRPVPEWDSVKGVWSGGDIEKDYKKVDNDKYKAQCSMSYFKENLRRFIYILVAIAGGTLTITLAWAGFVHMQESTSGESRSMARTIILRAFVGMLLLTGAFLAWEAVSGLFLTNFDLFETDPSFIHSF